MKSKHLASLALLFLATFGATFGVERMLHARRVAPALATAWTPVVELVPAPQPQMPRYAVTLPEELPTVVTAQSSASNDVGDTIVEVTSSLPQAGAEEDPEARARAVRDLRQSSPGNAVPALLQVLATDGDRRNRISAIQQLTLIDGGKKVPGIVQALRSYAGDADPVIAAQALEASELLAR